MLRDGVLNRVAIAPHNLSIQEGCRMEYKPNTWLKVDFSLRVLEKGIPVPNICSLCDNMAGTT